MPFVISADFRGKIKENEKLEKYSDLVRELKKAVEHKVDRDTICRCVV